MEISFGRYGKGDKILAFTVVSKVILTVLALGAHSE